ncbi:MAG: type II toxin-antitoxin system VapC family toxin [Nanoarchaeota archaeon]
MIYLDTNIFVYASINNGAEGEKCRKLLDKFVASNVEIATSVLTWDELVYSIWKKVSKENSIIQGGNFLKFPNLIFLQSNVQIINDAQKFVENYGLKPRDAIHVATALINKCESIVSDDSDFDKIKEIKRIKI